MDVCTKMLHSMTYQVQLNPNFLLRHVAQICMPSSCEKHLLEQLPVMVIEHVSTENYIFCNTSFHTNHMLYLNFMDCKFLMNDFSTIV